MKNLTKITVQTLPEETAMSEGVHNHLLPPPRTKYPTFMDCHCENGAFCHIILLQPSVNSVVAHWVELLFGCQWPARLSYHILLLAASACIGSLWFHWHCMAMNGIVPCTDRYLLYNFCYKILADYINMRWSGWENSLNFYFAQFSFVCCFFFSKFLIINCFDILYSLFLKV